MTIVKAMLLSIGCVSIAILSTVMFPKPYSVIVAFFLGGFLGWLFARRERR